MTPETTALVERLRGMFNGACETYVPNGQGVCECGFADWTHGDDAALRDAIARLSQERICSTCRHNLATEGARACRVRDSIRLWAWERARRSGVNMYDWKYPEDATIYCPLWEQADPKEISK